MKHHENSKITQYKFFVAFDNPHTIAMITDSQGNNIAPIRFLKKDGLISGSWTFHDKQDRFFGIMDIPNFTDDVSTLVNRHFISVAPDDIDGLPLTEIKKLYAEYK